MADLAIPTLGRPFIKGDDPRRYNSGRAPVPHVRMPDGQKRTLAELARMATFDSIKCLHDCVLDEEEDRGTRCRAAGYLLSLGWGAAPKEVGLRLVGNQEASSMNLAELLQLVTTVQALPFPVVVDEEPTTDAVVVVQDGSTPE